ncbi:MAG: MBL fold metallo-hydrolase [Thermodesulfobacteriota bacterium]
MNKRSGLRIFIIILCLPGFLLAGRAGAACRNPNLVLGGEPFIVPAAASGFVEITWFGHSFFQITSSSGTRIITDPFGPMGFPMPEIWPHVVTVGREHGNHNNVGLAKGDPLVLRGLKPWGVEWNEVNVTFRDVLIYNVPIHTRSWEEHLKGAAFVFEMDGLCVCHAGDLGEPFNDDQLDLIGHVDVLLVPIGGRYAMGPENAKKVMEQLKPKIAVPMHYFNNTFALEKFLEIPYRARFIESNTFSVSKDTLPAVTEIYVPKVIWHGDDRDM